MAERVGAPEEERASAKSGAKEAKEKREARDASVVPPAASSSTRMQADSGVDPREAPSLPPLPAAGPWRSYKEIVSGLASRIVEAQRPIRVLQAIRWDSSVEEEFKKGRY